MTTVAPSLVDLEALMAEAAQDRKAARKRLRQLAPTVPDDSAAQTALGLAYLTLEQPRDAVRAFKRAIELDPTALLPRYHLGTLQTDMGLLPQGEDNLRFVVAAEPDNPRYQAALGFNLYKANKRDEALPVLETAARLGSEDADVFAALGYLYYFAGRLTESRDAFGRTIALNPDYAEAYNNRGYLHILLGDLEAARADLETCVEKDSAFLRAHYNLALVTWLRGDRTAALQRYRQARQADKGDAELQQHLHDFDEVATHQPQHAADMTELRVQLAVAGKVSRKR
jgi:Flp pilus assembly protein TadD